MFFRSLRQSRLENDHRRGRQEMYVLAWSWTLDSEGFIPTTVVRQSGGESARDSIEHEG